VADAKEVKDLKFTRYPVTLTMHGPLHATTASNPESIAYQLRNQPSEPDLAARLAAGEPLKPMDALQKQVEQEAGAAEPPPEPMAVFRRDDLKRPFIHDNFIRGHLRDAGEALSRALGVWGLQQLITRTVFVRPERIYLPVGCTVEVETWPAHSDVYRMGRISSIRRAEFALGVTLEFRLYVVNDPRWAGANGRKILTSVLQYGAIHGIGGGRGRGMGRYTFMLGEAMEVEPAQVWSDMQIGEGPCHTA